MNTSQSRVTILYLLLLVVHVAHVFEEVWGRFRVLNLLGVRRFLIINWLLFCIPVGLFYFVLRAKRWAYRLSQVYAGLMIVNGLGHNLGAMVTKKYFDGFAGGFTGIWLAFVGVPLFHYLKQESRAREEEV